MIKHASDILSMIDENRQAFMRYTIARIRELLRNLPQSRSDLFHILPFLLHVNGRRFPGYVDSDRDFYGIFRFEQSGFYKVALRLLGLGTDKLKSILPRKRMIHGVYLMGSAGTLTQTGNSDFDFWVIVREDEMGAGLLTLLEKKLRSIERWCREKHGQDVTFFIMDINRLKQNEFSTVDGESSGSAQRTLLKDEFYRTFIMIAGKIPLWAVAPPGLGEEEFALFIESMDTAEADMEHYIDTGHLYGIDSRECLGALLWQVYKARKDPVKSLIKSSLCACYALMGGEDSAHLVSTEVRSRFSRARIDDYQDDPYALVFEKIMEFYRDMNDTEGLELIRQCIFLRLSSYPLMIRPDEQSPKGRMLARFVKEWNPDAETRERLMNFSELSEIEKITFEDRILDKLSFLYELILRSSDDENTVLFMKKDDLEILKNRTAAFLRKKPGKIARCSSFLRAQSGKIRFSLTQKAGIKGEEFWAVHECHDTDSRNADKIVFTCDGYLHALGFLFSNLLHTAMGDAKPSFFDEIVEFFHDVFQSPDDVFFKPAVFDHVLVLLKASSHKGELGSVEILSSNSWGEFHYDSMDVSAIESPEGKCYKITELLAPFRSNVSDVRLKFLVFPRDALKDFPYVRSLMSMTAIVEDKKTDTDRSVSARREDESEKPRKKTKPFLDLL